MLFIMRVMCIIHLYYTSLNICSLRFRKPICADSDSLMAFQHISPGLLGLWPLCFSTSNAGRHRRLFISKQSWAVYATAGETRAVVRARLLSDMKPCVVYCFHWGLTCHTCSNETFLNSIKFMQNITTPRSAFIISMQSFVFIAKMRSLWLPGSYITHNAV